MKKRILNLMIAGGFIAFAASCGNETTNNENGISTETVENNATASGEQVDQENAPQMTFEKEVHDFGEIVEGEKVEYAFKFTNTGKSDLVITEANASCGCTVPNHPKEPIAPGKTGVIEVVFDSKGKVGKQDKKITIIANTVPNTVVIKIAGTVNPAVKE